VGWLMPSPVPLDPSSWLLMSAQHQGQQVAQLPVLASLLKVSGLG